MSGNLLAANNSEINTLSECLIKINIADFTWRVHFSDQMSSEMIIGRPFIAKSKLIFYLDTKTGYFKFRPKPKVKIALSFNETINSLLTHINVGSPTMQGKINEIVKTYPNVFSDAIGQALNFEEDLKLSDNEPVCIRPYFLAPPVLKKVKDIIEEWFNKMELNRVPLSMAALVS